MGCRSKHKRTVNKLVDVANQRLQIKLQISSDKEQSIIDRDGFNCELMTVQYQSCDDFNSNLAMASIASCDGFSCRLTALYYRSRNGG